VGVFFQAGLVFSQKTFHGFTKTARRILPNYIKPCHPHTKKKGFLHEIHSEIMQKALIFS